MKVKTEGDYMKASRGEIKIFEILTNAGLTFQEEYSFPDLISTSGRPLRFDFAVFDDNGDLDFLSEYQGIQHYEPKSKGGGLSGLRNIICDIFLFVRFLLLSSSCLI